MHFILTSGWEDGIADLTQRLAKELAEGKRVLWLVSGGSNISASVQVAENISDELNQLLTVMLADERYGEVGHADSNWAQLLKAGFNTGKATVYPVLQEGLTLEGALERYDKLANQAFAENDLVIAQLGIGTDGHIAGILPESPAAAEQQRLVAAYESESYSRLTLTFPALLKVTASYTFAFGSPKQEALRSLHDGTLDPVKQPAQILREIPEAYVYNDQLGENS